MHRRLLARSLGALLLAAFGIAGAQNAYTSRPMNVRAGPNREYPLVAQLGPGAPLDVHGCLSDWSWCDASFDGNRGWIYSGGLSFVYQGERVPLYSYGPSLGLPIIAFSLLSYWNDYYTGRPWYAQRNVWAHRSLPPHMRPPGRPHAGPPPMAHGRGPAAGRAGGAPVEERGRAAPPGRGAQPAQRTHGSQPRGRAAPRGGAGHGGHGGGERRPGPP